MLSKLEGQPEVKATLLEAIGIVFGNLGYYDRAEPLLREALAIRREVLGPDDGLVTQSLTELGKVLTAKGKPINPKRALRRSGFSAT